MNNSMPSITVIIPNYNHENYLQERIESVLNQSFQDFELIILDDCSTDSSESIIQKYASHPKVNHIVINEHNSGSTFKQWNKGVALAKAKWIWLAESDDSAHPDFLQTLFSTIQKNPSVTLAYCQSNRMDAKSIITGSWITWTNSLDKQQFLQDYILDGKDYINKYLIYKNTIPNASGVLFKKETFDQIGGADENIKSVADWVLWLKIAMEGSVAFVSQPLNNFRYHSQSVITKSQSNTKENQLLDLKMRKSIIPYLKEKKEEKLIAKNQELINKEYIKHATYQLLKNKYKNWRIVVKESEIPLPKFILLTLKYIVLNVKTRFF